MHLSSDCKLKLSGRVSVDEPVLMLYKAKRFTIVEVSLCSVLTEIKIEIFSSSATPVDFGYHFQFNLKIKLSEIFQKIVRTSTCCKRAKNRDIRKLIS